jgi:hypothetical protein
MVVIPAETGIQFSFNISGYRLTTCRYDGTLCVCMVAYVFALHHKYYFFADVCGMVANALKVARYQYQANGARYGAWVRHHVG